MKIKYLGTGAAEGIPAVFCDCPTCQTARKRGGKNIRTRSQAIIDNSLLVDFPADTYWHFIQYGFPLSQIHNCLITHSHPDHLYPAEIELRINGFSHLSDPTPLTFYSDVDGYNKLKAEIDRRENTAVEVKPIELYKPFEVEGYTVTALRATHSEDSSPVVFLIEKDGKVLFYSNDTSEYPDEAMEFLANYDKKIDLFSLDCTEACGKCTYDGHLTLDRSIALRDKLSALGVIDDKTLCVLNHFSHNGINVLYEEFVEITKKYNFIVAYDGMEIEF